MLATVTGTFVPRNFRSWERKFHRWNFRSLELSFPGTFVPMTDIKGERKTLAIIVWLWY